MSHMLNHRIELLIIFAWMAAALLRHGMDRVHGMPGEAACHLQLFERLLQGLLSAGSWVLATFALA